jgi:hypothetical protein
MKNWKNLVYEFRRQDDPNLTDPIEFGMGVSDLDFDYYSSSFGVMFPEDFRECYGQLNGFGFPKAGDIDWFLFPLELISELQMKFKKTVEATHPSLGARYIPIVNWGNGDLSGYLKIGGILDSRIFMFEHESYAAEEGQNEGEFIVECDSSLYDFLIPG